MEIVQINEIEINPNEFSRSDEELHEFRKRYSEKHIEIKMIVGGLVLKLKTEEEIHLESIKHILVLESEEGHEFQIIYEVKEIWSLLLAFIFDSDMNYSFRFSFGKGTLFPFHYASHTNEYFMRLTSFKGDILKDWNEKKSRYLRYINCLTGKKEKALPFLWYGKGIFSNDQISSFLNYYRVLELLAREYWINKRSELREIINEKYLSDSDNRELINCYDSINIEKRFVIPLYFEETDLADKITYNRWRKTRNKLTHGDWSLEFNHAFIEDVSMIRKVAKNALERKAIDLGL
jgi:hypothetical protein